VQLYNLRKDTELSKKSAFAEGAYKNLKIQFKSYFLFCTYFKLTPLPTTVSKLRLYGEFFSCLFLDGKNIKFGTGFCLKVSSIQTIVQKKYHSS
jgi:hypothetical protein